MSLIGTPAPFDFEDDRRMMILNVLKSEANPDFISDALFCAGIGNIDYIFVYGPFENGLMRIEVVLKWFDTEVARSWQGTMMDSTLKAQICVSMKSSWVFIPVPVSYSKNQLWQEDMGNTTPTWYQNVTPETEVLSLETIAQSTRATATLMLTETETEEFFEHKTKNAQKETPCRDYISLTMY